MNPTFRELLTKATAAFHACNVSVAIEDDVAIITNVQDGKKTVVSCAGWQGSTLPWAVSLYGDDGALLWTYLDGAHSNPPGVRAFIEGIKKGEWLGYQLWEAHRAAH